LLVATADVDAVLVAPAQPEGDVISAAGRAGMSEPWVARLKSWMPGPCVAWVESRAPHGAQLKLWVLHWRQPRPVKQEMEVLLRVGRSDR
jgi:hypothetical protein